MKNVIFIFCEMAIFVEAVIDVILLQRCDIILSLMYLSFAICFSLSWMCNFRTDN